MNSLRRKFKDLRRKIRWLTPAGKVDHDLRKYIDREPETQSYQEYRMAYRRYRYTKRAEVTFRILLYAGLVTSFAAAIGLEQLQILQNIAGYIGVTFLILFYALASYFNLRAREEFYFRREIFLTENIVE